MPENTVTPAPNPAVAATDYACRFDWCTEDHFVYGWDQDLEGNPTRFHRYDPDGDAKLYLVVEETRTAHGETFTTPTISMVEEVDGLSIDEGLAVLHSALAVAAQWREIADEFDAAGNVIR